MKLSRRAFLATSTATASTALLTRALPAQVLAPAPTTRPNIAQIDHLRILAAAENALAHPPTPSRSLDSEGWLSFTVQLPALAAAATIDPANAPRYTAQAVALIDTWLLNPATKPVLTLDSYKQLAALAPLAETAVALPFLQLDPGLNTRLQHSFAAYLKFLTEDTTALLARDAKDHNQSSWLLQVAALARFTGNDTVLTDARHRFRTQFIRAQINAAGYFPHEVNGDYPYRDSLWNLDMLAGSCLLLSTRFDDVWAYELQDGPGMRAAIAFHAPFIRNREHWPYRADLAHFNQLPCRRPALVFAGRAYQQADYVALWQSLSPAEPTDPDLLRTFPIRQPLLWLTQPKRQPL